MIGLESLRWLLTLAFGAASVFHLARCLRPPGRWREHPGDHRLSEAMHLVMGASMVVMVWPWGSVVPAAAWVAVFVAATGWFLVRAVRTSGERLVPGFFATAMAAMVWMAAEMPLHAGMMGRSHHGGMGDSPLTATAWVSGVLGVYLVVAAVWWALRGMRLSGLSASGGEVMPLSWSALCHGVMSAGMGVALLAMM